MEMIFSNTPRDEFAFHALEYTHNAMDDKLRELMPEDEYKAFMKRTVRESIRAAVMQTEDSAKKKFWLENFDEYMDIADDIIPSPWD